MNENIMVSICCLVYNHEKYLRQCLQGFMMQKTSFKFEVLIHDDASTDGSVDIIMEYEKKYPEIIKPVYQKENQYSKDPNIWWNYQFPTAKGKYIALCEGDDYWTDEYKLQKQFEAMEHNMDCVLCTHTVRRVRENGTELNLFIPNALVKEKLDSESMTKYHLLNPVLFQTSSYFFRRNAITQYIGDLPHFIHVSRVGDAPLLLLLSTKGNFFYIKDDMSCYRTNSIGSWTSKSAKWNIREFEENQHNYAAYLRSFDNFTGNHYSKLVQERILKLEMQSYAYKNDYKKCLHRKYRTIFKKLSFKTQVGYVVFAFFPFLRPIYIKLRYKR